MPSFAVLPPRRPSVPLRERGDIQGLLRHGYPYFDGAAYCLFRIDDVAGARRWLARLLDPNEPWIDRADSPASRLSEDDCGVALAFTASGLGKLGLGEDALCTFVSEFREGMAAEHRARLLGDAGESHPDNWQWGRGQEIDGLLIVFAGYPPPRAVARFAAEHQLAPAEAEVRLDLIGLWLDDRVAEIQGIDRCPAFVRRLNARLNVEQGTGVTREPFGFADGVSQPFIEGLTLKAPPDGVRTVRTGEFVLGHLNEMDRLPASPSVSFAQDPHRVLPRLPSAERADFGRNGTFLVMRQLEQNVRAFEEFIDRDAYLAARMVGRWHTGEPLVRFDEPHVGTTKTQLEDGNGFGYDREDRHGFHCPIGAHIRRANPRDALAEGLRLAPEEAQRLVDQHRILRRGRVYSENGRQGLLFICLNANIERQFEFVQSSWLMNPEFGGLWGETDPIIGNAPRRLTTQHPLLGECREGLPQFVTVRGGAYFFLPGLRSLRYLSQLP